MEEEHSKTLLDLSFPIIAYPAVLSYRGGVRNPSVSGVGMEAVLVYAPPR